MTRHPELKKQIGYYPIHPTAAGRGLFDEGLHVYHWHGDGFELPAGGTLLATGSTFPNEAFSMGENAYGVQFHPEIDGAIMRRWIEAGIEDGDMKHNGAQSGEEQEALRHIHEPGMQAWFDRFPRRLARGAGWRAARGGRMTRVAGKVALVTGAGQGIGRACAELLAREGAQVAAADINAETVALVADAIEQAGDQALALALDVTDEAAWQDAIARAVDRFGGLDILVNNAGVAGPENVETTDLALWRRIMGVNLTGTFLGMKHAIPKMRLRGGARSST